ncbi:MAG: response regulator, partial [Salinibacter sp.]|uniref:response regulator n=1 Tax=Salinibacter sp. TaxID=2065818 RepID=UPI002FC3754D
MFTLATSSFSPTSAPSASLLLVDDDPVMQSFVSRLLAPDYDVAVVGEAEAAIERLRQHRPDTILLDLNLPETDGHALLERLQSSDDLEEIPVMVLSGRDGSDERVTSLRLGAQDHLNKPFNPEEL